MASFRSKIHPQTSSPPRTSLGYNEIGEIGSYTLKISEMIAAELKKQAKSKEIANKMKDKTPQTWYKHRFKKRMTLEK